MDEWWPRIESGLEWVCGPHRDDDGDEDEGDRRRERERNVETN